MTRIDFYEMSPQQQNQDLLACQLCQKAYDNNQFTLLLTQSSDQTTNLDRLLWTYSEDSFLPHDTEESPDFQSPILIQNQPNPKGDRQLLINLSNSIPSYFAQFERVIEVVTDQNRQQARKHYSFYKERGYPLNHHNL